MLVLVWTVTSSALRAPPWVLLDRHAAAPSVPWMNALMLTGIAVGGAVSPYLGVTLKNLDPRLPFAVSSLALLAATAGLIWVERALSKHPARPAPRDSTPPRLAPGSWMFAALAGATLVRIAAVLAEMPRHPGLAPALDWAPFALWLAAGLLFAALAWGAASRRAAP